MAEPVAQQAAWFLEGVLQEAECKEQRQLGDGSSLVVLSRRDVLSQQDSMWLLLRSQGHLLSLSVRVPLQRFDDCHKLVDLVCTEKLRWCLVRYDTMCLWSYDVSYNPECLEGKPVHFLQEEAIYCPHCDKNSEGDLQQ